MTLLQLPKTTRAALIALLFHGVGLAGIFSGTAWVLAATPLNLLLSTGLLIWSTEQRNRAFWMLLAACFITGMITEIIGVNTGLLFGDYRYGAVLGPGIAGVPWVIGCNWFIVIFCCGTSLELLLNRLLPTAPEKLKSLSLVVDGAILAVLFDWLIEPVAVRLGYWTWNGGDIPVLNYVCWWAISFALLLLFRRWRPEQPNKFAVHLLLIQILFFLVLRTFLQA